MHVIYGQKLLIAYDCCYTVMPSLNKISYLILSFLILCFFVCLFVLLCVFFYYCVAFFKGVRQQLNGGTLRIMLQCGQMASYTL